jgi:hypothetical protein
MDRLRRISILLMAILSILAPVFTRAQLTTPVAGSTGEFWVYPEWNSDDGSRSRSFGANYSRATVRRLQYREQARNGVSKANASSALKTGIFHSAESEDESCPRFHPCQVASGLS